MVSLGLLYHKESLSGNSPADGLKSPGGRGDGWAKTGGSPPPHPPPGLSFPTGTGAAPKAPRSLEAGGRRLSGGTGRAIGLGTGPRGAIAGSAAGGDVDGRASSTDEYAKDLTKNAGFGLADQVYLELTDQRGKTINRYT